MITWDEPKRRENLQKHEIDFADLESVFDGPMVSWKMLARAMVNSGYRAWACGKAESSSWCGLRAVKTPRI
jgi:uncharacterized DUF497 family protein